MYRKAGVGRRGEGEGAQGRGAQRGEVIFTIKLDIKGFTITSRREAYADTNTDGT